MISAAFIVTVLGSLWAIKKNIIRDPRVLLFIILSIFFVSLTPSLHVPYVIDDVDTVHDLAMMVDQPAQLWAWHFTPHNEHVIPVIKGIYYVMYKNFWLNPQIFHLIIIMLWTGALLLCYQILFLLTGSLITALGGAALLAATNLFDFSLTIICDSHILYCLFLFLLNFYAQLKYLSEGSKGWRTVVFLSAFLLPLTFGLGLTVIVIAPLFEYLCISKEKRKDKLSAWPIILAAAGLAASVYVMHSQQILFAKHYQDVGGSSLLKILQIPQAILYLGQYLCRDLIPYVISEAYFAYAIFFGIAAIIVNYQKSIHWKPIIFFIIFGLLNTLIVFSMRMAWGPQGLIHARYDTFPGIMIIFCYMLIFDSYLKTLSSDQIAKKKFIFFSVCLLLTAWGGSMRYAYISDIHNKTAVVQKFYLDFNMAFQKYLNEYPDKKLIVKNTMIGMPLLQYKKAGHVIQLPLGRYLMRQASHFAEYILPKEVQERIVWGEQPTDPSFIEYISKNHYEILYKAFE